MSKSMTLRVRDAAVLVAASEWGFSVSQVLCATRPRAAAHARQYAMWLLRQRGYSFPEIGRVFDKDHTTAMSAFSAHEGRALSGDSLAGLARVAEILGEGP